MKPSIIMTGALSLSLLIAGCGDGGGDGGNPGPGTGNCNGQIDTDGDGLNDCDELSFGTHPEIKDTDGDGFLDKEEVENWDRLGGNHLRFNPLVADVPRLRVAQMGTPVIQLYATTTESGSVSKGMSDSNSSEVEVTTSRGRTNTHKIEEQHTVNVNAEVQKKGPITAGSVSASYGYQHTDTTTDTSYWNETTVETNRQASSEFYETLRSETVVTKGGEIKVLMSLINDGDVSYTVNNMDLTAYMENPSQPGSLIAVGTLSHDGDLSYTPDPLGPNVDPNSVSGAIFNFVYDAEDNPEEISRILESSNQLVLQPTNLSLTGQRADVDLNLAAQNIRARTVEVIIDYGDHQGLATERYRVAVDNGNGDTLSFADLMQGRLNVPTTFGASSFTGQTASRSGLTSVRNIAMSNASNSYWLLTHTFTPAGSPIGTRDTELYNILGEDYSADDIKLSKGDVLHMVYVTDTDLDGLSDRLEILNGTDINLADTDQDGLDDALETYGWYSNLTGAPCDEGDSLALVFGNPLVADSDQDNLTDLEEYTACTNPMGELMADAGNNLVASQNQSVTLVVTPTNYLDSGALSYQWTQLAGPSVGTLSNTPSVNIASPDEVATLLFRVDVTDNGQNNQVASDEVRVIVARDKNRALFIDEDTGHDFNNDGRPETPIRTLQRGLELAQVSGADLYLNTPDGGSFYSASETLVLPANSSVFGGFDANWLRDPVQTPTPIQVSQAVALKVDGFSGELWLSGISVEAVAPMDGSASSAAVQISNGNSAVLDRVIARGGDLTVNSTTLSNGSRDFISGSSYGVLAQNLARIDVIGSALYSGSGAQGPKGVTGARGATGARGGNASGSSRGGRGDGNGNGMPGGNGANAATRAICADGSAGSSGSNSGSVRGGDGGRAGSATFYVVVCEVSSAGSGGSVSSRAATGSTGTAATLATQFDSQGLFAPRHGTNGGKGVGGAGGGGGGSGPGWDANDGGGGGGGGEGGDGGQGGGGGRGAGGSFAMVLSNVQYASIEDSELIAGNGGTGGAGGYGGAGGSGGGGGSGADSGLRRGGNGGSGGSGGYGGTGGGGAGGPSAGLMLLNGTAAEVSGLNITTGTAGSGASPNRGIGGWNYGIYADNIGDLLNQSDISYTLGSAGNSAPRGETNLP